MEYIAVFAIGTSSMKGVLMNQQAEMLHTDSALLDTHFGSSGQVEQHPYDWWKGLKEITSKWWKSGVDPKQIVMITCTGQMENVIPISKDPECLSLSFYCLTFLVYCATKIHTLFPIELL